jgi:transcription elongation GreA/GreB family factor
VDKREMISQLVERLQSEADALARAAKAAHEAATHEESRAEDSHDTRGLEASYLAGAQAGRAADILALISVYRMMPIKEFGPGETIAPGALVELEQLSAKRKSRYFMVPRGGGAAIQLQGASIQVIAPQSPLGEALVGRRAGEEIEVESQGMVREYRVVSVQ